MTGFACDKSAHQLRVEEFMRRAGQPVAERPALPSENIRSLRARLILEEALETVEALGFRVSIDSDAGLYSAVLTSRTGFDLQPCGRPSLIDIADGCADISVVTTGTLSACGIPDEPLLSLVDENNLAKFGPGHSFNGHGKLIKPPTHRPPDIAALLQGYTSEAVR